MKRFSVLLLSLFLVTTVARAQEKLYTCINEQGQALFSIKAKWAGSFNEGRAVVQRTVLNSGKANYRYGYIDTTGKDVIPCQYAKAGEFRFGVAWVMEPGSDVYTLIDKTGKKIATEAWKKVGYFFEGRCAVYDDKDQMGFIDRWGKLVIPCKYLGSAGFEEGLACVMPHNEKTEMYGFIDTMGKVVIPFQFKQAGTTSFNNGESRAVVGGVTCLIDRSGKVIFKPRLTTNMQGFYNGLCAAYTNNNTRSNWGYFNRNNEWVIKPQFDNATSFVNGRAEVCKAKKYGIIDTTGKFIIPMKYATIFGDPVETGFYGTEMVENGEKTYLKADGTPFTTEPMKYLYSARGQKLIPYSDHNNKYGYMNRDGTVFMRAAFESNTYFSEGKAWVKGEASSLTKAPGATDDRFVREFVKGEKVRAQKNSSGNFYPGVIRDIGENYYLVLFDDRSQEWVTFGSIRHL